ncbi:sec-independent translocase [Allonocardiopsis opalescens]|uniref:Sec-independent protein translocase protein TatB n=1 Tax=Allonocardiopsis opalescens TaxID=1144618 RepID=A0A2T0Q9B8_9ACTN|nr:sec-independent translocase [Allonocardiopsis opalescens]PRY00412.1 sec-independent protein translocase protein TatB [Allonocardiopsis opalescens]
MFNIGLGEFLVLGVLALLVFGPDQLPKIAAQAARLLRQVRSMADNAKQDLREGLGPEFSDFEVTDLNPRNFVRKHLFEDGEDVIRGGTTRANGSSGRRADATAQTGLPAGERPPYDSEAT